MSEPSTKEVEDPSVPLFDVVIRMPTSGRLEDIECRARDVAGLPEERIQRLIKVLRSAPHAKVGAGVTREKADLATEQFTKSGLLVEVTPVLSVQASVAGAYDGTVVCPACDKRIVLPDNRQCPSCGVFVDKITPEFLLKRKVMEQERSKIEFGKAKGARQSEKRTTEMTEAAIRAQVRKELEREYGIGEKKGLFGGNAGKLIRGTALITLVATAFFGGQSFSSESMPWRKKETATGNAAKPMSAASLEQAALAGVTDAAASSGTAAALGGETGDPDLDDPLLQAAGGKRVGAKGLTIEQAVAAAQVLGKAVGNTTVERAMNGGGGSPAVAADAGGGSASVAGAQAKDGAASAAAGSQAGIPPPEISRQTKALLTADFAVLLAELGQTPRAREVLKAASTRLDASANPETAAALRVAELKAQAWAVQHMDAGRARQGANELKTKTAALTDPVERTQVQGHIAAILSSGSQLPPELARLFLALAAESLKSVAGSAQPTALGDLAVSVAEVFAQEATSSLKVGAWSRAQASATQVENLIKQAPGAWAQMRLQAIDHQVKLQLGQDEKAAQSLDEALAQAEKTGTLLEQSTHLRGIARLGDAATQDRLQAATAKLQAQLEPKSGMEKAQALTQLTLLYTQGGMPAKADQFRQQAQATAGLAAAESTAVNTELIVRSDLAMARLLQGLGRYAEAEAVLQRVGGYLF